MCMGIGHRCVDGARGAQVWAREGAGCVGGAWASAGVDVGVRKCGYGCVRVQVRAQVCAGVQWELLERPAGGVIVRWARGRRWGAAGRFPGTAGHARAARQLVSLMLFILISLDPKTRAP